MAKQPQGRKLTPEETQAMTEEERKLDALSRAQLEESRKFLCEQIKLDPNLNAESRTHLLNVLTPAMVKNPRTEQDEPFCEGFYVSLHRVGQSKQQAKQLQVQIGWTIHDDVIDYLKRPHKLLPKKLIGFLDGGVDFHEMTKKAAVDLKPQTGKTRTGIEKYDRGLKS